MIAVRTRALGILFLSALFLSGCASLKGKVQQPIAYDSIRGELGKVTYTLAGTTDPVPKRVPWDAEWSIKNGLFSMSTSAFKLQAMFGVNCFQTDTGMQGSPWAGLRFFRISYVGGDIGFDKQNFTAGLDYLYRGIGIGPNVCFPYTLGKARAGLKAGAIF